MWSIRHRQGSLIDRVSRLPRSLARTLSDDHARVVIGGNGNPVSRHPNRTATGSGHLHARSLTRAEVQISRRSPLAWPSALLVAVFCIPTAAHADALAYVRASSQYKSKDIATFHPINLLDDDPATIWCEGAEGLGEGEELRIFFKKPQKIDRVIVGPTPKTGRLIQVVQITDGANTIRVRLDGNSYIEQAFSPPMKGSKYVITISQVGGPNKMGAEVPDDVACLGDMLLFLKKRPFGGRTALSSFRYHKYRDQILGPWNGGPLGAPEKFITFALDGSWNWSFEPLMGGRPKKMKGEYRFRGNRLLMRKGETGRWSDVRFKYKTVEIDREDLGAIERDYYVISFNNALGSEFAGEYNDAEF